MAPENQVFFGLQALPPTKVKLKAEQELSVLLSLLQL